MLASLKDKVALVVGGNSGLGRASALAFAAAGARVVIAARRSGESLAVVEEIQAAGGTAAFLKAEVTGSAPRIRAIPRWRRHQLAGFTASRLTSGGSTSRL